MTIINLTPHTISILDENNKVLAEFHSSGVARCVSTREQVDMIGGIPINRTSFGELTGLPEEKKDTMYIVSAICGQAAKAAGRKDCLITDDAVRDDQGRIIGCRALAFV